MFFFLQAPTLIFFQENAGNMGHRLTSMKEYYRNLGVNIFMVSYRGYGRSGKKKIKKLQPKNLHCLAYGRSLKRIYKKKIFIASPMAGLLKEFKKKYFIASPMAGLCTTGIMCIYACLYIRIQVRGRAAERRIGIRVYVTHVLYV
jgi:hypothetical protein